jgi:hypothetical protein
MALWGSTAPESTPAAGGFATAIGGRIRSRQVLDVLWYRPQE